MLRLTAQHDNSKSVSLSNILSAEKGISFGIPDFFPWPLNTVLGFFTALLVGTILFKTVITMGEVSLFIHLAKDAKV